MKPWAKLTLFGAAMVLTFGVAFGAANVLVPETAVHNWLDRAENDHAPQEQRDDH